MTVREEKRVNKDLSIRKFVINLFDQKLTVGLTCVFVGLIQQFDQETQRDFELIGEKWKRFRMPQGSFGAKSPVLAEC
ncbi:hypothetical protein Ocin01_18941 [Orchesella cincta]|uniref:Uncharacterized protein n=1 Tax=Orchesella cincta TaxID=48709 RepID=A0A1D2M4A9_ORCCI|nr:hypothetical protein Ocin01_18941 [Orchesella cincta]